MLNSIACKLASRGLLVFRATSLVELLLREIPRFRQFAGPLILIVDNFFRNADVIKAAQALGRQDLFIITSARTYQFEFQQSEVANVFGGEFLRMSVDELSSREVRDLVEFLQLYGLWGKRHSWPVEKKIQYVSEDCSRELRVVILDILDAPNIKSKIEAMISIPGSARAQQNLQSILVISQLLNLASIDGRLLFIGELLQMDCVKEISSYEREIRDFSFVRNGNIIISSSILSEYILRNLIDTGFVIDTMCSTMRRLDVIHDNDLSYQDVFKTFTRFSFLESAISETRRRQHLISYFEQIKDLRHCRDNSLFWLQYAMCRLSLEQYWEAQKSFDVAYSISNRLGYKENRHLDNQYARFLLESRTKTDNYTDYMAAFNKAHSICVKQMQNEPYSYNPYRVTHHYRKFIERRGPQLETGDLVSIFRSCSEVNRFISKCHASIKDTWAVKNCAKEMSASIAQCREQLKALGVDM